MSNDSTYVCTFVRRRKADLIELFGGKCCLCGFNSFQEALEFHHVNPEEKSFSIASSVTKNLESQLQELKKCILVCSNCHRGIHAHYYKIPENWRNLYNEEYADILRKKLELTQRGKIFYCKSCGKEITKGAQYCVECSAVHQRKVKRPNREELKRLIRTDSFLHIGKLFDVSNSAIRKWCKAENLPYKKTEIQQIPDSDWEKI